jgi:hypothetical protein
MLDKLKEILEKTDGKIKKISEPLPDGSGFMIVSFPLPENHWIYENKDNIPPMPLRMGANDIIIISLPDRELKLSKEAFRKLIKEAGKYAVRSSTMNGKEMDFDPDALVTNLVTAFVG